MITLHAPFFALMTAAGAGLLASDLVSADTASTAIPAWAGVILLGVVGYLLHRLLNTMHADMKQLAIDVKATTTSVSNLRESLPQSYVTLREHNEDKNLMQASIRRLHKRINKHLKIDELDDDVEE